MRHTTTAPFLTKRGFFFIGFFVFGSICCFNSTISHSSTTAWMCKTALYPAVKIAWHDRNASLTFFHYYGLYEKTLHSQATRNPAPPYFPTCIYCVISHTHIERKMREKNRAYVIQAKWKKKNKNEIPTLSSNSRICNWATNSETEAIGFAAHTK